MTKIRKIFLYVLSSAAIFSMACSGNQSDLEVTMVPSSAVLIPAGTTTVNGGYFSLTAPYFTISSINLHWKGSGTIQILAIIITLTPNTNTAPTGGNTSNTGTSTTTNTTTCSFGGTDLVTMFPALVNSAGVPQITQNQAVQESGPSGCSLTIPTPVPSGYSLNGAVQVIGASVDSQGNTTGRVTGTANITVQ